MNEAKPFKLAILASGNGSNFQAIVDAIQSHQLKSEVVRLVSDKADAYVIQRAHKHHIPATIIERKNFPDKESFEKAILTELQKSGAEWIILAGYMRIISSILLEAFPQKILNIHPSLLPKFPGLHAIEQAWKAGEKKMGCTVHFVDEGCDTGPIIAQSSFELLPHDTLESITERMHQHEHKLYIQVLQWIETGKL